MKRTITKTIMRSFGLGLIALSALLPGSSSAQWCNATSNGFGTTYGGNVTEITVAGATGTLASYASLGNNTTQSILNTGAPFDITSSEFIDVTLKGNGDGYGWGWGTYAGVWIDGNRDGDFSDAGECIADPQTGPYCCGKITNTSAKSGLQVPCTSNPGKTRMRIRACFTYWPTNLTSTGSCGNPSIYGNQFDLEVNIKAGTAPTAAFTPPSGVNYNKAQITFNADNPVSFYKYIWNFNPPGTAASGTPASAVGAKAKSSWASAGNYDVKLTVDYCGTKDSITKLVKIVAPTNPPVADFIASSNLVEVNFDVQLYDLSTNGAYTWSWELTSPTGNVYTRAGSNVSTAPCNDKNPCFTLDEVGKWSVCLVSTNDIGNSTKLCKNKYIECTPPGEFYMGPNTISTNQKGILYDHAGPTLPYNNNRKTSIDYFTILPCGAKEIRMKFKSLKLADVNDILTIRDGKDGSGKVIATINGSNYLTQRTQTFKALSGAMYLTFQSNGSGTDSGWIANWESDLTAPVPPKANWTTDYNPAANSMMVNFLGSVKQGQGNIAYEWLLDDGFSIISVSTNQNWSTTFFADGSYNIGLRASTCNGDDTFWKAMVIATPSAPGLLDFTADNVRPKVGATVTITTKTDYANNFEWSIFPTTFTYVSGNQFSQNPQIKFLAGGPYTFTLKAWNSAGTKLATEKKLIKNKYVVVLDYCIPPVNLLSSDVGINKVELMNGATTILSNETTAGDFAYTDYADAIGASMTFGAPYSIAVSRKTNSNDVNYKAWIDFNIDGDFNDPGEEIMSSGKTNNLMVTGSFTVPSLSNSFEGKTKMRVGVSYGNFSNTPCGVNDVGEFEDYFIVLANDNMPPVIKLVGSDTVRVEKGTTITSCYQEVAGLTYTGSDATEGNLTNKVLVTTDLDCTVPGIYGFDFTLTDASGNKAIAKRRTVIVVLDRTAPVLTLNGAAVVTVEQCGTFNDPGAVAFDKVDGNLTSAILVSGTVNTSATGSYTLTYTAADAQGNTATLTRTVNVVDTKKPGIYKVGVRIANNTTVNVQINSVFVDDIYADDVCNGSIAITKTPGFNGPVNTAVRATYPITYTATDPSGNKADEYGYTINYKVDDYIAPEINLNTADTIIHDVNNPYYSRAVTVSDNYYPLNKLSVVKVGSVDAFTLGTYIERYTATDGSGNATQLDRVVKVVDRVAPTMLAPAMNVCIGEAFWGMSGVLVNDNYYSPSALLPLVKITGGNINIWEEGVYYINYELVDPSGNQAKPITRDVYVKFGTCQNIYAGVQNIKLKDAVTMYPNPTSGELTIGYNLTNNNPLSIEVYNTVGMKVTEMSNLQGGVGTQKLDLGKYGSGTYMVRLTNNGESTTRQIVVTK